MMDRAEAIIRSCSEKNWEYPRETIKIIYVTNFAEKKFALHDFSPLEKKIPGLKFPMILLTMNGATFNYYYYITNKFFPKFNDPFVLHLDFPQIQNIEVQPGPTFPNDVDLWGRHVIYLVALSDALLDRHSKPNNQAFFAVNLAIKEPLERDLIFEKINTAVLMLSPCFLDGYTSRISNYKLMQPKWASNWAELDKTIGCLLNSNRAVIKKGDSLGQEAISLMLNTATIMYDRRLGATLASDRRNDSDGRMIQKEKPTIVLVTDMFHKNFVDDLPDDRFKLKVYALNSEVFQHYKSIERVDFVRLLNPNSPGEIPIRADRPEPQNWDGKEIGEGMPSWQITLITIVGTATATTLALLLTRVISFKFCRKQPTMMEKE